MMMSEKRVEGAKGSVETEVSLFPEQLHLILSSIRRNNLVFIHYKYLLVLFVSIEHFVCLFVFFAPTKISYPGKMAKCCNLLGSFRFCFSANCPRCSDSIKFCVMFTTAQSNKQ